MSIKIDKQYDEPWKVMKAASEGKRVAMKNNDGSYRENMQPRLIPFGQFIVGNVAIIDESQPEINWNGFDWEFFNQYGGLAVDSAGEHKLDGFVHFCSNENKLRESPFYPWFGGKCPVPGSCEVRIRFVYPLGHEGKIGIKEYTYAAKDVDWMDSANVAFRLTGRVL